MAVRACIALTVAACLVAVAWPAVAGARALAAGGPVPESFDGARTAFATIAWAVGTSALATLVGWPVGRAMRAARGGNVARAVSVVAAVLPPYAVFWAWWQATGPGSWIGDWCAAGGRTDDLRGVVLASGLVSWAWPLAAWAVAAGGAGAEEEQRDAGAVDGEGLAARAARAWRTDRAALGFAFVALAFVVAGSTAAFDLAQVPTYGFELRALDVQGEPAGTVLRAGMPAVALAAAGALFLAVRPVRPRPEGPAPVRRPAGVLPWAVLAATVVAPAAVIALAVVQRGALDRFGALELRGAVGTLSAAAGAGTVIAAVACGHLLLAALGASGGGRPGARRLERAMLAAWTFAALVPATVAALALVAAWNLPLVGPWVYDTPAIMVLSHVGRFAVVGAWIGRLAALREPSERRELRAVDGGGPGAHAAALAPELRAAALSAFLAGTVLAAGEVIASARLEPPGWAWSSSMLLNAIHYQQPATVLGCLLALMAVAGAAGASIAVLCARGERLRGAALAILGACVLAGCREAPAPPGGPQVRADAWFGAPGRGRGQFEYPRVLEIDPRDGTVLVVDRQARIQRFRPDGSWVGEWSMPEKDLGKPTGMGIGPDGRAWVADTHYHRVVCWSPDGRELLRFGRYGEGPGEFIYPCDVEVGPDGNVWVAEFGGNDRIQVFSPEGVFVRSIGGHGREPGRFDRPQSIAFTSDGRSVVVADACNHRIQVLDLQGRPLRSVGSPGPGPGQLAYPYGLRLVDDRTALVTEFGNHRIQCIDLVDGRSLGIARTVANAPVPLVLHVVDGERVRSIPSGENALRFPWAVGIRDGEAFVLDSGHSRVLRARLDSLRDPAAGPYGGRPVG